VHLCGHLFGPSWRGDHPPREQNLEGAEDWLTSPGGVGSSESARRHGRARSPDPSRVDLEGRDSAKEVG